jgi:phosphoglycolate phosphatase
LHRVQEPLVKVWLGAKENSPFADRSVVFFDLDGTLLDSSADLTTTLRRMFSEDSLPEPSRSEVVRWVGDGAAALLERAYQSRGVSVPAGAMARFKTHHDACCLDETAPYEGIPELLATLGDRRVAVVTNKPTPFAEKVVAGTGLGEWVRVVVGPERAPERKPSPAHCLAALELLGASPDEAVMVGDGTTDIAAGRDAGLATIGVLWGFRSRQALETERPDALAHDVSELRRLLGA